MTDLPPTPSPSAPLPSSAPLTCAACAATITGHYCAFCGAAADAGHCTACGAPLSPGARFCHHCGAPVKSRTGAGSGRRERTAWIVAGIAAVAAIISVLWGAGSFRPAGSPEMANPGNLVGGTPSRASEPSGLQARPAPDISNLTPEQRFDRLFERVMRAGENSDSATVQQFAPMALGAYALLDSTNTDLRFHAALVDLAVGQFTDAQALADSILAQAPGHLFGYIIRGEAADRQNQSAALTRSYRDFLAHYDAEMRAGRKEYAEHKPIVGDFLTRARASTGR